MKIKFMMCPATNSEVCLWHLHYPEPSTYLLLEATLSHAASRIGFFYPYFPILGSFVITGIFNAKKVLCKLLGMLKAGAVHPLLEATYKGQGYRS
jgi:hypothetical protein